MARLLLLCVLSACLQAADAPAFDVASIRPHAPDDSRFVVHMPANGHFSCTGSVAKLVMMLAYDVQESQISGGPGWLDTEKWDIDAQRDDREPHSVEETRRMLQTLFEQRFSLQVHRSTEPRPAYLLTVSKGGPKFKAREQEGSTNIHVTPNSIRLEAGTLDRLAQLLATALGRPVIDETHLTGRYDLDLQWDDAPVAAGGVPGLDQAAAPGNDRGSIFTAIQNQLGLRLEPQRAPVEVIVIDRIERPSAN